MSLEDQVEIMIYTCDVRPYYGGEMITTWNIPSVERELDSEQP